MKQISWRKLLSMCSSVFENAVCSQEYSDKALLVFVEIIFSGQDSLYYVTGFFQKVFCCLITSGKMNHVNADEFNLKSTGTFQFE